MVTGGGGREKGKGVDLDSLMDSWKREIQRPQTFDIGQFSRVDLVSARLAALLFGASRDRILTDFSDHNKGTFRLWPTFMFGEEKR